MMSFFPAPFCAPAAATADASFTPLFRLLEDFDNYSRQAQAAPGAPACRRQFTTQPRRRPATFNPKFDIRETEKTYELHGELPGLERENVNIEFTEPDTMVIRGHVERSYGSEANNNATTEETHPGSTVTTENTENASEETAAEDFTKIEKPRSNSFQPTVEDDPEESTPASTPASSPKPEVAKPAAEPQTQPVQSQPRYRRWERSVGEFARTFTFPALVDHDAVTASLNNGILTVTVPKAAKPATRRIEIISY